MNRASPATGWVRNPVMMSPDLDPTQASSYELGWTFNPITGCLNGCPYCYARKLANGRLRSRYLANENIARRSLDSRTVMTDPFYPRFWEDRLKEIERPPVSTHLDGDVSYTIHPELNINFSKHAKRKAKGIFTCDMSDLFGIGVPEGWTRQILNAIESNGIDRFYLLTKQPQNLIRFSPFPDNCWVGVTATNRQAYLDATSARGLDSIEAKVKYISFEPLLEQIGASDYRLGAVNWVIIGAQTKPYKPPEISWVEEIVMAADKAGIPVFLKDNLKPLLINDKGFGNVSPGILIERELESGTYKLRQEMPKLSK